MLVLAHLSKKNEREQTQMEQSNFITVLGLTAGVLTTIAYLPQLIKTWKSKSAHDLSWSMLVVLCTGIILWLVYGAYIHDIPIIAANIVTFLFAGMILVLKIKYK
jgi:MtN3 and saliva related transmembrane protein